MKRAHTAIIEYLRTQLEPQTAPDVAFAIRGRFASPDEHTATLDDIRELVSRGYVTRHHSPSGVLRYSIAAAAPRAKTRDTSPDAAAPAQTTFNRFTGPNREGRELILSIMRRLPAPTTKRAITDAADGALSAHQVAYLLDMLATEHHVARVAGTSVAIQWIVCGDGSGWVADDDTPNSSPAPAPARSPSATAADAARAEEPTRKGNRMPAFLIARAGGIQADISGLIKDLLDAGVGRSAVQAAVAAGDELRRVMLTHNQEN